MSDELPANYFNDAHVTVTEFSRALDRLDALEGKGSLADDPAAAIRWCKTHEKGYTADNIKCDWWFLHAFDERRSMIEHGKLECETVDAVVVLRAAQTGDTE